MGKINGLEDSNTLPPKVCRMYEAVIGMMEEGYDVGSIRVSMITERAGIGKGTAYEYFDTKEDIVVCAILYQVRTMFTWLEKELGERESFRDQLCFLLDEIEKKNDHKSCFLRFVHLMTDHSEFSRLVQEKLHSRPMAENLPMNVFGRILASAAERGELRSDLPLEYMTHCLFAHLLVYMMAVISEDLLKESLAVMRPLVYRGILNELEDKKDIKFYDSV